MKKTIFVVDDSMLSLTMIKNGIGDLYNVKLLKSGKELQTALEAETPALILLDMVMPAPDGLEILREIKKDHRFVRTPVIMLTAMNDEKTELRALNCGAVDFIAKPFSVPVLRNRVDLHVNLDSMLTARTTQLVQSNRRLQKLHRDLLIVLADIVESRDNTTGGHVTRTVLYTKALLEAMLAQGVYSAEISLVSVETLAICASLHDIGKIAVADSVLNKPGKLTNEEFEEMKAHTTAGARILTKVIERVDAEDHILSDALLFAEFHHECWDGSGYPHGLAGEDIPVQGRIMAIADVYDALVSERPYKKGFTDKEAVDIIMQGSGTKFDPRIVDVFLSIKDMFKQIHEQCDKGNASSQTDSSNAAK